MKLLLCVKCNDTFSLGFKYKECSCGLCGGQYIDNLNAKVWGDPEKSFVLGFANSTFTLALRDQLHRGDLPPTLYYGGQLTPPGREFTAFVIPNAAASVERVIDKFDPIVVDKPSY